MLDGPSWGPANKGAPRHLIVLCHGLGADGNDLIDIAPGWGHAVPDALFISVNAPEAYEGAPFGRQWFSVADRTPSVMAAGVRRARVALDEFLDATLTRLGLAPDAYAMMGFSQGAMTALYTGLRRPVPPRAILSFSGRLLGPDSLAAEITGRPPVLLVHGEADDVVPVAESRAAEQLLRGLGVPVESLYPPTLPHGIDEAGITLGALTLQRVFSGGTAP